MLLTYLINCSMNTALHIACRKNSLSIVELLLAAKCNPNKTNLDGAKAEELTDDFQIKQVISSLRSSLEKSLHLNKNNQQTASKLPTSHTLTFPPPHPNHPNHLMNLTDFHYASFPFQPTPNKDQTLFGKSQTPTFPGPRKRTTTGGEHAMSQNEFFEQGIPSIHF